MENQHKPNPVENPEGLKPVTDGEKKGISIGKVDSYMRFLIFLVGIGLVYIWNAHRAEKQVRMLNDLENNVRELKTDFANLNSELSYITRQSVLEQRVDSIGLFKMDHPPYVLE